MCWEGCLQRLPQSCNNDGQGSQGTVFTLVPTNVSQAQEALFAVPHPNGSLLRHTSVNGVKGSELVACSLAGPAWLRQLWLVNGS